MKSESAPSGIFWVIATILLLWGMGEYIANIPLWAIAVGIVAAVARLLGAIALLLRSAWALPLYLVSLPFFLMALYRAFVLADVATVMSLGHIATEVGFVTLSVFAIWFAYKCKANGTLQ